MKALRHFFVTSLVLGTLSAALWLQPRDQETRADTQELAATKDLKWFKGNLHTHSLWSDGDDYLEAIALWYRQHDYQFLAFTDHNTLADRERWVDIEKNKGGKVAFEKLEKNFPDGWVNTRKTEAGRAEVRLKTFSEVSARMNEPGSFLLIQGEEVSDSFGKFPIHMNASNVKELIVPRHGSSVAETIQNNTDALISQRERTKQPMMIHLNHPNFGWGVTAEDLMAIRGENFFEVYNGHPGVRNSGDQTHASTERIWDIVNTRRVTEFQLPLLFGLATDDGHSYHKIPSRSSEPGRGWVMVLTKTLEGGALVEAMDRGQFYASSGVALAAVTSSSRRLSIKVEPQAGVTYRIEFIGTRRGFDPKHSPVLDEKGQPLRATEQYSEDIGKVLSTVDGTSASYDFIPDDIYVRARVTSSKKHPNPSEVDEFERAWAQPVLGPAGRVK